MDWSHTVTGTGDALVTYNGRNWGWTDHIQWPELGMNWSHAVTGTGDGLVTYSDRNWGWTGHLQ